MELRPRLTLAAPLLLPHARAVVAGVVADGRGGGDSLGDSVDGGDSESHSPATQLVSPSEAPPGGATLEPWRKRERGDDAGRCDADAGGEGGARGVVREIDS